MTTPEERRAARALLDHAKAGGVLSRETITECLLVLGDLPRPDVELPLKGPTDEDRQEAARSH